MNQEELNQLILEHNTGRTIIGGYTCKCGFLLVPTILPTNEERRRSEAYHLAEVIMARLEATP